MKYLSALASCFLISSSLSAAQPAKKLDISMTSDIGAVNTQASLAYNQKHWSLTQNNITFLFKIVAETDDTADIKIKIYKNPENCKDRAKLVAEPRIITTFGQKATITVSETNRSGTDTNNSGSYLSLVVTLSKE